MSYYTQAVIDSYVTPSGIEVIVREGLNDKAKWELRLVIPKELHDEWYHKEYVYDVKDRYHYFAVDSRTGQVSYYYYVEKGNGFYGAAYTLQMKDGSAKTLKGPWASNSRCMNMAGFPPSKEVNIQSKYNMASAMTNEAINKLLLPLEMEVVVIDHQSYIIRL